jgi:hypothetical protein
MRRTRGIDGPARRPAVEQGGSVGDEAQVDLSLRVGVMRPSDSHPDSISAHVSAVFGGLEEARIAKVIRPVLADLSGLLGVAQRRAETRDALPGERKAALEASAGRFRV